MININLNQHKIDDAKETLDRLKQERKELILKDKLEMPMTDEEMERFEFIDVHIEQQEFIIEWLELGEDI